MKLWGENTNKSMFKRDLQIGWGRWWVDWASGEAVSCDAIIWENAIQRMSSWGVQWPRGAGTTVDPHHSFSLFPSCPWSQCGLKKTNRNVASRTDWWCGTSYLPCRLGLGLPPSHQLPRPDRKIATWWRWHNRRNKWQNNLFRAHCGPLLPILRNYLFNTCSK